MASINYAAREISVKIVYYGPGLSGKTTNLQVIHRKVPPEYKSDMVSLATETDRTLFFDFLPLDLGKIKGFATKFQLYTVPGQVYYNATRKLVLRGVDGVVFVADSAPDKVQENLESFQNLEENLAEYGYKRENVPIIIQYNKRDLPNAMSIEELQQLINKYNLPWGEAVANKGQGVFDSLKLIGKIVIDYLNKKYSRGTAGTNRPDPNAPMQYADQRRPMNLDNMNQPYNQYPSGSNQYSGNMGYQSAGNMSTYQQPFQQPQVRSPQQPRPGIQQPPRPMQQGTIPPVQGRMSPPPIMPVQKPVQQSFYNKNPQQSGNMQQNAGYFPPAQSNRPPQQGFNRVPQPQNFEGVNQNQFAPPQPKPSIQKAPAPAPYQAPNANAFELDPFDDSQTFEPQPQMPMADFSNDNANQNRADYYDYGAINLEPMDNQQQAQANEPEIVLEPSDQDQPFLGPKSAPADLGRNQFEGSGKTDLDLEIEKYQREIEEKQKKTRVQPNLSQQANPKQQMPYSANQGHAIQGNQFASNTDGNDYDVYNMEMSSFPQNQPPTQRQPAVGVNDGDDAMFFTSVDPERQKRPVKKPIVNPRNAKDQSQQQKGFLSKFFNRDTP